MKINEVKNVLKMSVDFILRSPLLLRSGEEGEFTDSTIERTADGRLLHVNGYVWASLLRRSLTRLNNTEELVKRIGKYDEKEESWGVSSLWCESSFSSYSGGDVRPGIKINRKWGAVATGALYSDEIEMPGQILTMNFYYFCAGDDKAQEIRDKFLAALLVINEGIENIGGGWSYGFGRLSVADVRVEICNLTEKDKRGCLWKFEDLCRLDHDQVFRVPLSVRKDMGWTKIRIQGSLEKGQMLAIHSNHPVSDMYEKYKELTDAFVFRRLRVRDDRTGINSEPVITGKAFRQAILSIPIERWLHTEGVDICKTPGELCTCDECIQYRVKINRRENNPKCKCRRCQWFGATDKGGIIAVLDAPVIDPRETILHRIQLCEHSFQNIQLFSGEYLTGGTFITEIIIDYKQVPKDAEELESRIYHIINELGGTVPSPPGWYRLGATATCTGQFTMKGCEKYHVGR